MTQLIGKTLEELKAIVSELGMPSFTAKQISEWLYKKRAAGIDDMTNISAKTSRRNLSYVTKDYTKIAVVFPILPHDEYNRRNDYRKVNENK